MSKQKKLWEFREQRDILSAIKEINGLTAKINFNPKNPTLDYVNKELKRLFVDSDGIVKNLPFQRTLRSLLHTPQIDPYGQSIRSQVNRIIALESMINSYFVTNNLLKNDRMSFFYKVQINEKLGRIISSLNSFDKGIEGPIYSVLDDSNEAFSNLPYELEETIGEIEVATGPLIQGKSTGKYLLEKINAILEKASYIDAFLHKYDSLYRDYKYENRNLSIKENSISKEDLSHKVIELYRFDEDLKNGNNPVLLNYHYTDESVSSDIIKNVGPEIQLNRFSHHLESFKGKLESKRKDVVKKIKSLNEQIAKEPGNIKTKTRLQKLNERIENLEKAFESVQIQEELVEVSRLRNRFQQYKPIDQKGENLKFFGHTLLNLSKESALLKDFDISHNMRSGAKDLLDFTLGVIPGVSVGKDFYELVTGKNLVTDESIGTWGRTFAALGILTLGGSNHVKNFGNVIAKLAPKLIKRFGVGGLKAIKKGIAGGEKIYDSARKLGASTKEKVISFAKSFHNNPKALEKIDDITGNIALSLFAKKVFDETPVGRPSFYVMPGGKAIPATGYRHFGSDSSDLVKNFIAKEGRIPKHPTNVNYMTFEKIDDAIVASARLQVPHDARFRVTFDTLDNIDDTITPTKWGSSDYLKLEPYTKYFPQFGKGGASQAVTKEAIPNVLEVKDLLTGEVLFKK